MLLGALAGPAQAAPLLIVNDAGILIGADGVEVNTVTYNVRFVDGTCMDVFTPCSASDDFDFTDIATATSAAEVLLADVFINGTAGDFDSDPESTFRVWTFQALSGVGAICVGGSEPR
jgi:hypothetical protein